MCIRDRYRIDNSRRTKHTALVDCDLLAKVYINLIDQKEPTLDFGVQEKDNNEEKNKKMLRINQRNAINFSKNNNFESGVHFHATGTGKSWISLELILEYHNIYPDKNILWLCEQKSILIEQFNRNTVKEKGYGDIYKKFLIIDYTENKPSKWYEQINSAIFWKKSILLIINRHFLVSQEKYKLLKTMFDLIIHDECHSIQNITTQKFYQYMIEKNKNISCLGFSATPYLLSLIHI